ncbi:MAG TPA: hypothetical protein ENG79_09200 [Desulfobacteraceae bacterium]|nr:hypothetical protein [Desulfobacteraceae bacterium]
MGRRQYWTDYWAKVVLCIILGLLVTFALTRLSSALTPQGLLASDPTPSAEAVPLLPKVVLAGYHIGEDQNHMVKAVFYLQNNSDQDVKDVDILCKFYNGKGSFVDRKLWTVSGTIPAGKGLKHTDLSHLLVNTRSRVLSCRITDLKVVRPPFFVLHRAPVGHGEKAAAGHGAAH